MAYQRIVQKIDVFPKIHTVKTLYRLTSPLAIKYHIVRYNIQKTRMIYLSTEKNTSTFVWQKKNLKFFGPKIGQFYSFWSISISLKLIWTS